MVIKSEGRRNSRGSNDLRVKKYEAKAYLCLGEAGTLSAGKISRLTEIPHSKTYEVLARLERRGLIEVQRGRPMGFRAVPHAIALEKLEKARKSAIEREFSERRVALESDFKQRLAEISQAKELTSEELKNVFQKMEAEEPLEDFIWTITGAENIIEQLRDFIGHANREVQLILPHDDFSQIGGDLRLIASRGVKIELVVHGLTESVGDLLNYAEVFRGKGVPHARCGIAIVDDAKVMFISENYETGFKTPNRNVVTVLSHFYEHEKEESAKISR